jgi:hypothetical protein
MARAPRVETHFPSKSAAAEPELRVPATRTTPVKTPVANPRIVLPSPGPYDSHYLAEPLVDCYRLLPVAVNLQVPKEAQKAVPFPLPQLQTSATPCHGRERALYTSHARAGAVTRLVCAATVVSRFRGHFCIVRCGAMLIGLRLAARSGL